MSPDRSLPPYPPARVWSFPPPPVPRRWFWLAIAAMLASVLIGAGLVTTAVVLESADAPGVIEDPTVLDTISEECGLMTFEVEGIAPGSDAIAVAAAIREQNQNVTAMVDQIAALPTDVLAEDRPTLSWLNDWRTLVKAREVFATSLESGRRRTGPFEVPRDLDGLFITVRMEDALLNPVCDVPDVLLDPLQRGSSSI